MIKRVVINGRFLSQTQTGVQRYALETLFALDALLARQDGPSAGGPLPLEQAVRFELAVPPGTDVPPLKHIAVQEVGATNDRAPAAGAQLSAWRRTLLRMQARAAIVSSRGHLWEQLWLPAFAKDDLLLNFSYSGPLLKRNQLITVHDAAVRAMPEGFSWQYRLLNTLLVKALAWRVQGLMTVSEFSRQEIALRYGIGRDDVVVGLEGGEHVLRTAPPPARSEAIVRGFGLEPGSYVLAVGSLKANKNFGLISEAAKLLNGFPWTIAVAGAQNARVFGSPAVGPQDDGPMTFLGYVSDEQLSALYRHAAWFVFPSLYEGFGLPAVEAMTLGCPVLAADAASIPEVCGDAALYFDPRSPESLAALLRRVAREPGLRKELSERGTERLQRYTWQANAQVLLQWIDGQAPVELRQATSPAALAMAQGLPSGAGAVTAPTPTETPRPTAAPHIVHVAQGPSGGMLDFLVLATRELLEAGVAQTLLFSRDADTPKDLALRFDERVRLIELPAARGLRLNFIHALSSALRYLCRQGQYSAVHFHSSTAGFFGRLALIGLQPRPPAYYSPHGLSFLNRRKRLVSTLRWSLERLAAAIHCQPVASGDSEGELLRRLSKRAAFVLENPVPPEFFGAQRLESQDPLMVVTVGRACEQKAPDVFAELAVRFAIAESDVRFVWIGGGDVAYERLLRDANVEVTGWLPMEEVRVRLQRAAIYVQTSRWEGMPMSVLQALALGLPCVVTDAVGNRDAVRHERTGLIARNVDELSAYVARLATEPELRQRMGAAARRDAQQRFSTERFRDALLRLYGLQSLNRSVTAFDVPDPRAALPSAVAFAERPATLNG